jgi:metal-responsive CopG/Arc/MetJ family transcriptional regulator
MAVRKIAISVPEDVLKQIDRVAKRENTTRSGFITQVLSDVSKATDRAEITARINQIFGEASVVEEQASVSTDYLLMAAESSGEGTEW